MIYRQYKISLHNEPTGGYSADYENILTGDLFNTCLKRRTARFAYLDAMHDVDAIQDDKPHQLRIPLDSNSSPPDPSNA